MIGDSPQMLATSPNKSAVFPWKVPCYPFQILVERMCIPVARKAASGKVPACDLVWIRSTPFRLVRKGLQEPWRGTFCTVGEQNYLFTSGYVPWWNEYPGPHIPAPIEIGAAGPTDLKQRAVEILALSKMNWNSSEGMSRYPITLSFAKKVGQLMTELSENQAPNPSYRYYM